METELSASHHAEMQKFFQVFKLLNQAQVQLNSIGILTGLGLDKDGGPLHVARQLLEQGLLPQALFDALREGQGASARSAPGIEGSESSAHHRNIPDQVLYNMEALVAHLSKLDGDIQKEMQSAHHNGSGVRATDAIGS